MKKTLLWNKTKCFMSLLFLMLLLFPFNDIADGDEGSQLSRYRNVEVVPDGSAEEDEEHERARYRKFVEIKAGGSAEKALIKYNDWMRTNSSLAAKKFDTLSDTEKTQIATLMKDLYGAAGKGDKAFKNVALLIQKGLSNPSSDFQKQNHEYTQISQEINVLMAQTRELMIENMIMEIGKEKKWRIGRSDSGNMSSGLKSDLDQTFYVFELVDGEWKRNEKLDKTFIELFESRWEKKHQILSLEKLDIASIEGKNRFPDPRAVSTDIYSSVFRGTIVELRNTPGAYTTYGAVTQQMQLRALAAIEAANMRAFQVYEPLDKSKPDGKWDKKSAFDAIEAKRVMFYEGNLPEIMQSHAFGAAVSNFLELQKYMHKDKFETKYHLRVWDDTMFTSMLLEEGIGRESKMGKEYTDLSIEDRNKYNQVLLEKLFDSPETREKHEIALNISRDLRNLHKDKFDKVEAFEGKDFKNADVETKNQYVFDALARKIFNVDGKEEYKPDSTDEADIARTREQIKSAELMHRQLASEFCMESIHYSSKESFALMLDPENTEFNPDKVKHLMKVDDVEWTKTKKNLQKAAQLTFLYALYDLGPEESWRLLQELNLKHNLSEQQLKKLWRQGRMQGIIGVWENPRTYFDTYKKSIQKFIPKLNERVQRHVLSEFGFEKVSEANMAHYILETQNLTWNWRKLGKNMFADPGSIDALANISKSFFESDGDPVAVLITVLDEMFLAIPVIGQIESARRGGLQGVVLMGTAIKFPPVGAVLLVYSIGSTTFEIYDSQVGRPFRGNIEDAIYRGFAGPESVSYGEPGKPPPVFGADEQKRLDALELEVRQKHYEYSLIRTHRGTPQDKKDQIKQQWLAIKEKNEAPIAELKARKRDFEQYSKKGFWEGGYFGNNASKQQKWISDYLLKDIEPLHGFLTKGVVDFELEDAEEKIKALESAVKSSKNVDEYLENSMELFELKFRQVNYEKSQKYLDHALNNNPELLSRLKRDSLYENLRREKMVGVDTFVDQWFDKNEKTIAEELVKLELLDPDALKEREAQVGNWGFQGDPTGMSKAPHYIPDSVRQSVIERMRADVERSRALLAVYKKRNKDIKEKNRENMEKSKGLFQMEMTGVVAEELLEDPKMNEFIKALQYAAIPRMKPRVEVAFYKINKSGQHKGDGDAKGKIMEEFGVDSSTKLQVDPTLYHAPYRTTIDFLDKDTLSGAIESGTISNGNLLPETREDLRALQNELKDKQDKGEIITAVASVFASGMPDLTHADSVAIQGLPGAETGGGEGQVLLGQDIGYFEIKSLTVKADPIRVIVTDWAGNTIDDIEGLVTIADKEALMSNGQYWGTYEFTKHDEQIEIKLDYKLPGGESIKQVKKLSVNDFEDWANPQPPEPITFKLPILNPGTLQLKGSTKVTLKDKKHSVKRVNVECPSLQRWELLPVGKTFEMKSSEALQVGSPISIQVYGVDRKEYQGKKTLTVPAKPGVIDFGTIDVRSITKMVTIPQWDPDNPPLSQTYIKQLEKLGLVATAKLEKPASVKELEDKVYNTSPLSGKEVEQGSSVTVFHYDRFARKVPDVIGLPVEDALEALQESGFKKIKTVTGKVPEKKTEAERVEKQSIAPGTEHSPDEQIVLTIYDKYKPNIVVPRLLGMTEKEATEKLTAVKLKTEVMDEGKTAPDKEKEYRIYRQDPPPDTKVVRNELIKIWKYDKYTEGPQHGQGVDDGPATPFYVAFRLFLPVPKSGMPKKGKNEEDAAFSNRVKAFFKGLSPNDYNLTPLSETGKDKNEKPLPFHISKDALKKYPKRDFSTGSRFALPMQMTSKDGRFNIVLLVETINTYDSMGTIIQEFPSIKKNKQLQSFAFTEETGISKIKEDQQEAIIGPLRPGWSDDDKKRAGQFWILLLDMMGSLELNCFIASAVYQDVYSEEIKVLRQFRDDIMMDSTYGKKIVQLYYQRGPGLATWVLKHPKFIKPVKSVLDVSVKLLKNRELDHPFFQTGMDYTFFGIYSCIQFFDPDQGQSEQNRSPVNISEAVMLDLFSKFNKE